VLMLDDLAAGHLRVCWEAGRSSLLPAGT
jgi:hypothetical protein